MFSFICNFEIGGRDSAAASKSTAYFLLALAEADTMRRAMSGLMRSVRGVAHTTAPTSRAVSWVVPPVTIASRRCVTRRASVLSGTRLG